jgi:hypothetical protein
MERRRHEGLGTYSGPPRDGRARGRGGGQADAVRLGGRVRRVEQMEEGVGGLRARSGRGGGSGGSRGGRASDSLGGDAAALVKLLAVGGADLDAGGVAAQHLLPPPLSACWVWLRVFFLSGLSSSGPGKTPGVCSRTNFKVISCSLIQKYTLAAVSFGGHDLFVGKLI